MTKINQKQAQPIEIGKFQPKTKIANILQNFLKVFKTLLALANKPKYCTIRPKTEKKCKITCSLPDRTFRPSALRPN